jgi:hypothetical protein
MNSEAVGPVRVRDEYRGIRAVADAEDDVRKKKKRAPGVGLILFLSGSHGCSSYQIPHPVCSDTRTSCCRTDTAQAKGTIWNYRLAHFWLSSRA